MNIRASFMVLLASAFAPALSAWEAPPVPRDTVAHTTTALCRELTKETEAIESILLTIIDNASANAAAPLIAARQERVRMLLGHLENAPTDPQTGQEIMQAMMTITHISQRYLPLITHLMAQNAYGSTELAAVLRRHEAGADTDTTLPHVMLCEDMCSLAGELLYVLHKTTDAYTARVAAVATRQAIHRQSDLNSRLQSLSPAAPETAPQLQQVYKRLRSQFDELSNEMSRLSNADYYADPDLQKLLAEYTKALQAAHATH